MSFALSGLGIVSCANMGLQPRLINIAGLWPYIFLRARAECFEWVKRRLGRRIALPGWRPFLKEWREGRCYEGGTHGGDRSEGGGERAYNLSVVRSLERGRVQPVEGVVCGTSPKVKTIAGVNISGGEVLECCLQLGGAAEEEKFVAGLDFFIGSGIDDAASGAFDSDDAGPGMGAELEFADEPAFGK